MFSLRTPVDVKSREQVHMYYFFCTRCRVYVLPLFQITEGGSSFQHLQTKFNVSGEKAKSMQFITEPFIGRYIFSMTWTRVMLNWHLTTGSSNQIRQGTHIL
jgi:hypothetical protein